MLTILVLVLFKLLARYINDTWSTDTQFSGTKTAQFTDDPFFKVSGSQPLWLFIQGLQITGKQRISAWDLMEGYKNPSPLSWAWFGAVRIERKPLRYEQDFRRLLHHTHPRRRPLSYFLSPAPDKEDERDEEEDRTEAEAAVGERASQPSTPQTPADKSMSILKIVTFISWRWMSVQ